MLFLRIASTDNPGMTSSAQPQPPIAQPQPPIAHSGRRFATTRWSIVLAAQQEGPGDPGTALATLRETYLVPVVQLCTAARLPGSRSTRADAGQRLHTRWVAVSLRNLLQYVDQLGAVARRDGSRSVGPQLQDGGIDVLGECLDR